MMTYSNSKTAAWIIDQLVQQEVFHFCLAPGSRSTPLVCAVLEHSKSKVHTHYDERGLGFLALGIAKGQEKPAVLIVTSGTAVGNLLPAVMEAHHAKIPLILLTSDRPHELRDCGANQSTDQVKIFQNFVRWQIDLPVEMNEHFFRSTIANAYFASIKNPPGPVHINCPFREPLYDPELKIVEGKPIPITLPRHTIESYQTKKTRGIILSGKLPNRSDIQFVLKLAERLEWPVLADILSNARCTPSKNQIRYFDYIEKPTPEFVIHFGERMTSKRILQWLKEIRPEIIHVSPYPDLQDPERLLSARVQSDIPEFCKIFGAEIDPNWLSLWQDQEPIFEKSKFFTELHAMQEISRILPENYGVFLGNGMAIRHADHFLFPEKPKAFFSNRGLSGIDGNIATIAGLAEEMPMLGFIGDQTALYDLNSLPLIKKAKHPVTLIISNNFGGGIFHHLAVSASPYFETHWPFSHSMKFKQAADMFQIPYFEFKELSIQGTTIFELNTDRKKNIDYERRMENQIKNRRDSVLEPS